MRQFLKITTWVFIAVAVVFFWISLRSTEDNLQWTLYAFAAIVIGWTTNYFLKRYEKKKQED